MFPMPDSSDVGSEDEAEEKRKGLSPRLQQLRRLHPPLYSLTKLSKLYWNRLYSSVSRNNTLSFKNSDVSETALIL